MALLGPLLLTRDGVRLELNGQKRRALVTLLALHAGTPVSQEQIVDALWPQRRGGREASTLRVHVSHLRDVLEPHRSGPPSVLVTQGPCYLLARDAVDLDIDRFMRMAHKARSLLPDQPGRALDLLNRALELWRGRPLQDVEYEEFAQGTIRRLELTRIEARENRAEALIELGEAAAAIEDLEALVLAHPTRERPASLLMGALYRTGGHAESLRVARRHARALAEQGLAPSPSLSELELRILQHDPSLIPHSALAPAEVRPGRSVRGYEVREEAGRGPIGRVYRAFQSSVGREVALKVIHPRVAQDPGFVRSFSEGARAVAGLQHPHIVPMYDFWRDPDRAFLVTRWLEGGNLTDRMRRAWTVEALASVFADVADAVGYAHDAGVVHSNLTSSNVLFDGAGNAYVSDFRLGVPAAHAGGTGPGVAADVFALGVLLDRVASGSRSGGADETTLAGAVREVVRVATAPLPGDRYPDATAFRSALLDAVGAPPSPAPKRNRRNPYKGLAPFSAADRADFHGRDDVVENLLAGVASGRATTVIGPSGSGKSSVVLAGLVPRLRDAALPGSDLWAIVEMVPGTDPFEEFRSGVRSVALATPGSRTGDRRQLARQLAAAFHDRPALLVIDQFEEVFSSEVDDELRQAFLEDLVDLAVDGSRRVKIVLTLRADFSDRALAQPGVGDLVAGSSVLLAPMRPEQVEAAIRRPAARAGLHVEPLLVAEIMRDISSAPGYLPLLQYVLAELFERRVEDRLTVAAYRELGGVHGVLERRAEDTFEALSETARGACRQLFLRLVHLGDHGEETRRRLPLTELQGLGRRADVDEVLGSFSEARLLTFDRDPLTRTPTLEVAHETVLGRWTRYRTWIDEARHDVVVHGRLAAAASAWAAAGEDPSFLLTGGPLVSAVGIDSGGRIALNTLEARFLDESRRVDSEARQLEADRRRHEAVLEERARFAAMHARQNTARELAAASVANLASDTELSVLLALEAAQQTLAADEGVLPEAVDALHRAVISPRVDVLVSGAGTAGKAQLLSYAADGSALVALAADGGAMVLHPETGRELARIAPTARRGHGVAFHPDAQRVLTIHGDAVRQWDWRSGTLELELGRGDSATVSTAAYSRDGALIAIGAEDGTITVWRAESSQPVAELAGHSALVTSIDFDPSGGRLLSGSFDATALVWDIGTGQVASRVQTETIGLPIWQVAWHPFVDVGALTTAQGELFPFRIASGERMNSFGNGKHMSRGIAFDSSGSLVVAAGDDGFARIFGTFTGGEAGMVLPGGGVPVRDAVFQPATLPSRVATVGVDGNIRIWSNLWGSERPARLRPHLYPHLAATPDGRRYVSAAHVRWSLVEHGPTVDVVDAGTGACLLTRPTREDAHLLRQPAISVDGSLVAFAGPGGDVEVVEVDTGAATTVPGSRRSANSLAFSPDGSLLAGAGSDGSIAVWETRSGKEVRTLRGHGDTGAPVGVGDSRQTGALGSYGSHTELRVDQIAFHPDGSRLASCGFDGTVRIWDLASGAGRILHRFRFAVDSVTYAADGSRLAAADATGNVVVLDADSGAVVATPQRVPGRTELVFSPDGRRLAGAGPGPVAHLWDLERGGRLERRFHGAIYGAESLVFVNGGTELRVASGEGVERSYVLDPVALVELAREVVSRDLTAADRRQHVPAVEPRTGWSPAATNSDTWSR